MGDSSMRLGSRDYSLTPCYWKGMWQKLNIMRQLWQLCDVSLYSEDRAMFMAHSSVLAASSEVMHSYFVDHCPGTMVEMAANKVLIPGMSADVLQTTLDFVYGVTPTDRQSLQRLKEGAEIMGIHGAVVYSNQKLQHYIRDSQAGTPEQADAARDATSLPDDAVAMQHNGGDGAGGGGPNNPKAMTSLCCPMRKDGGGSGGDKIWHAIQESGVNARGDRDPLGSLAADAEEVSGRLDDLSLCPVRGGALGKKDAATKAAVMSASRGRPLNSPAAEIASDLEGDRPHVEQSATEKLFYDSGRGVVSSVKTGGNPADRSKVVTKVEPDVNSIRTIDPESAKAFFRMTLLPGVSMDREDNINRTGAAPCGQRDTWEPRPVEGMATDPGQLGRLQAPGEVERQADATLPELIMPTVGGVESESAGSDDVTSVSGSDLMGGAGILAGGAGTAGGMASDVGSSGASASPSDGEDGGAMATVSGGADGGVSASKHHHHHHDGLITDLSLNDLTKSMRCPHLEMIAGQSFDDDVDDVSASGSGHDASKNPDQNSQRMPSDGGKTGAMSLGHRSANLDPVSFSDDDEEEEVAGDPDVAAKDTVTTDEEVWTMCGAENKENIDTTATGTGASQQRPKPDRKRKLRRELCRAELTVDCSDLRGEEAEVDVVMAKSPRHEGQPAEPSLVAGSNQHTLGFPEAVRAPPFGLDPREASHVRPVAGDVDSKRDLGVPDFMAVNDRPAGYCGDGSASNSRFGPRDVNKSLDVAPSVAAPPTLASLTGSRSDVISASQSNGVHDQLMMMDMCEMATAVDTAANNMGNSNGGFNWKKALAAQSWPLGPQAGGGGLSPNGNHGDLGMPRGDPRGNTVCNQGLEARDNFQYGGGYGRPMSELNAGVPVASMAEPPADQLAMKYEDPRNQCCVISGNQLCPDVYRDDSSSVASSRTVSPLPGSRRSSFSMETPVAYDNMGNPPHESVSGGFHRSGSGSGATSPSGYPYMGECGPYAGGQLGGGGGGPPQPPQHKFGGYQQCQPPTVQQGLGDSNCWRGQNVGFTSIENIQGMRIGMDVGNVQPSSMSGGQPMFSPGLMADPGYKGGSDTYSYMGHLHGTPTSTATVLGGPGTPGPGGKPIPAIRIVVPDGGSEPDMGAPAFGGSGSGGEILNGSSFQGPEMGMDRGGVSGDGRGRQRTARRNSLPAMSPSHDRQSPSGTSGHVMSRIGSPVEHIQAMRASLSPTGGLSPRGAISPRAGFSPSGGLSPTGSLSPRGGFSPSRSLSPAGDREVDLLAGQLKKNADGEYPCVSAGCWYTNRSLDYLQSHMHKKHGIGVPDKACGQCAKGFFSTRQLSGHVKRAHCSSINTSISEDPAYADCGLLSLDGGTAGVAGQPLMCPDCGLTFDRPQRLQTHRLRQHFKGRLFACDECSFKSPRKKDVQAHMVSQHNKIPPGVQVFTCQTCSYKCTDKNRAEEHEAMHTGQAKYKCDTCGKSYTTRRGMRTHMLYHSNDRPFACEVCGAAFKVRSKLRDHVRLLHTHVGVKPFQCGYCNHTTALRGNCNQHIRKHHPGLQVKVIDHLATQRKGNKPYDYANMAGDGIQECRDIKGPKVKAKPNASAEVKVI